MRLLHMARLGFLQDGSLKSSWTLHIATDFSLKLKVEAPRPSQVWAPIDTRLLVPPSIYFFNLFIFNWRIIALQYCVGFYHTSTWISHGHRHVSSPLNLPPSPNSMPPLCCCSVAQSCLTVCDPTDCRTPGFPVLHHLPQLAQTHVHWDSDYHPAISVLCHSLLLLPSIFPSIRAFSNESALCIRWPK